MEAVEVPEPTPKRDSSLWQSSRWRPLAARGLCLLILVWAGFIALLYALQDRVIFPGAATQGAADAAVHPQPGSELLRIPTSSGQTVAALYGPALTPSGHPHPDPMSRPAFLYFYGNAMCLAYCEPEFERFRRLGFNVMIPDYLGYGMSTGKPSEKGCRETAEACLKALQSKGFQEPRIIVGGWSLGGAVAIDLVSQHPLGGLIAFSTFTSAQDMGRTMLPLPVPSFLYTHRFESLKKIPAIKCPILLGHGRRDTLVPFHMFQSLAAAAKAPLQTLIIDGAEHNDFFQVGGKEIDHAITRFVEQLRH
jgi:pimeloyl-ACP methyl ester carboxylesterase